MPKQYANIDYTVPMRGVNTEATPLAFPEGFCVSAKNVELDYNPLRIRVRNGLVNRSGYIEITDYANLANIETSDAISTYLWQDVNETPDEDFIIIQVGFRLYFLDATKDDPLSNIVSAFDISAHAAGAKTADQIRSEIVDYSSIKGVLVVVGNSIEPLMFQYTGTDIEVTELKLKIRDVYGVADGLAISERPTTPTISDEHRYNLKNQGWDKNVHTGGGTDQDPIAHFKTEVLAFPSNADILNVALVEGVDGDAGRLVFKPKYLKDQDMGNSPAPKGRYIVDPFNIDRQGIADGLISGDDSTGGNVSGGGLPSNPSTPSDPNERPPWYPDFPNGNLP